MRKTKQNNYRIEGDLAFLELTNFAGDTIAEAIISAVDLPRAISYGRWHLQKIKNKSGLEYRYVRCSLGKDKKRALFLHRFVLRANAGILVDHINGNGLDNTRKNLRLASYSDNRQNINCPPKNKNGYRNVTQKKSGSFEVSLQVNGERYFQGTYPTLEEAALVAQKARQALCPYAPLVPPHNLGAQTFSDSLMAA